LGRGLLHEFEQRRGHAPVERVGNVLGDVENELGRRTGAARGLIDQQRRRTSAAVAARNVHRNRFDRVDRESQAQLDIRSPEHLSGAGRNLDRLPPSQPQMAVVVAAAGVIEEILRTEACEPQSTQYAIGFPLRRVPAVGTDPEHGRPATDHIGRRQGVMNENDGKAVRVRRSFAVKRGQPRAQRDRLVGRFWILFLVAEAQPKALRLGAPRHRPRRGQLDLKTREQRKLLFARVANHKFRQERLRLLGSEVPEINPRQAHRLDRAIEQAGDADRADRVSRDRKVAGADIDADVIVEPQSDGRIGRPAGQFAVPPDAG
jgi:hypothetical protein